MKTRLHDENTILGVLFTIVTVAVLVLMLAGLREIFQLSQQIPVDEMKDSFPGR